VPVLGVLGGVEVRNRHKHLGQLGVVVLARPDASLFESESFWVDEDLFPEYFVELLGGRLGLGARLVLVVVLGVGTGLGEFEALVGVVKLLLLIVLLTVEVGGAFLRVLAGGWLVQLDLRRRILFEGDSSAQAGVDWGDLGGVLRRFGC